MHRLRIVLESLLRREWHLRLAERRRRSALGVAPSPNHPALGICGLSCRLRQLPIAVTSEMGGRGLHPTVIGKLTVYLKVDAVPLSLPATALLAAAPKFLTRVLCDHAKTRSPRKNILDRRVGELVSRP